MKFIRLSAIIPLACMMISFASAQTDEERWSFDDHPHPSLSEMTTSEKLAFLSAIKRNNRVDLACRRTLQTEYEIYLDRYPGFFTAYDERERFKQWKRHMALNPAVQDQTCLYGAISHQLFKLNGSKQIGADFWFCNGRFPRQPRTSDEKELVRLVDELMDYAHMGSEGAVIRLVGGIASRRLIQLEVDIHYYFLTLASERTQSLEVSRRRGSRAELIKPQRRAFIDKAVKDRDLDRVINTLEPCLPKDWDPLQ